MNIIIITILTWKLILVLSNGAIVLLANAPAMAPAAKLCNTLVEFESCFWSKQYDYNQITKKKTNNNTKFAVVYLCIVCHHARRSGRRYFSYSIIQCNERWSRLTILYLAAVDNHRCPWHRNDIRKCSWCVIFSSVRCGH